VKITTLNGIPKALLLFLALACELPLATHASDADREKQQKQIRTMAQDTLQRLYKGEPKTKLAVKHAYGYRFSATWV
jgi:hypothetical protein